ncbi:MAG: hypothetical protein Q3Y08_05075 [Butyricicoccus sp.]|nr:hypothetical protein [Butyricicoccus sp.]
MTIRAGFLYVWAGWCKLRHSDAAYGIISMGTKKSGIEKSMYILDIILEDKE